jgi:hypothetical protein
MDEILESKSIKSIRIEENSIDEEIKISDQEDNFF